MRKITMIFINGLEEFLVTFFNIFLIFWQEVFIHRAENKLHQIESNISEFQKRLKIYTEKYPFDASGLDNNITA